MNETVEIIFGLLGGLALFLFGMNNMSDSLQKTAGDRMRKVLGFLTRNPLMGALAGALVTAVLQSSSATTVMAIGFVSSGLMTLPQAISVIFGANIGTTVTAQLMTLKITDYIYPIIFVGFIIFFVCKNEKIKNIGMVIFSFGLLFEGIEIMGNVMKPLADSPIFLDMMGRVSDIPVLGIVLGAVMTVTVQSSSATIAVLQNFASQVGPDGVSSIIGLAGAVPILLGDNIGTTITALIASIGQSKNAKRTAVAHTVFNVSGTVVCALLMPFFIKLIVAISPKGDEIDVISNQIANAHTVFNICCTLIWLPLIPLMVKIVSLIVRGSDRYDIPVSQPLYLDEKMFAQPLAAMYLVSQELWRSRDFACKMLASLHKYLTNDNPVASNKEYVEALSTTKNLQEHISTYITKLLAAGTLNESQSEHTAGLLLVSNNLNRICDRCEDIVQLTKKINAEKRGFSDKTDEEMGRCFDITEKVFSDAMDALKYGDVDDKLELILEEKQSMNSLQNRIKKAHLKRLRSHECNRSSAAEYTEILYNIDRIVDSCISISDDAGDGIYLVDLSDAEYEENFNEIRPVQA